jgi:hypothetical protein
MEAAKEFRRLKAYKHLPALGAALAVHSANELKTTLMSHSIGLLRLLQQNLRHPP